MPKRHGGSSGHRMKEDSPATGRAVSLRVMSARMLQGTLSLLAVICLIVAVERFGQSRGTQVAKAEPGSSAGPSAAPRLPGLVASPRSSGGSREAVLWLNDGLAPQRFDGDSQPGSPRGDQAPQLRFGLITDVQYADKESLGPRHYREAADRLKEAVLQLNQRDLGFVANLGDLIDGRGAETGADLDTVLGILNQLKAPVRHVIGNHCAEIDRATLQQALRMTASYYDFPVETWRFVVLDGMDVSVRSAVGSPQWREARVYLRRNPYLPTYNGAIGANQLQWLRGTLNQARSASQRVVVFCHHSLLPAASDRYNVLWNWEEVVRALASAGCVVAVFTGHDHRGGYAQQNGIHHVTLPAIVESAAGAEPYVVVDLFSDRLVLRGNGVPRTLAQTSQTVE